MSIRYYGIFPNGKYIEHPTLDKIKDTADIEFIFRCDINEKDRNWPKTFTLITSDGIKNRLKIGNFELVDIGEQSSSRTIITIKDLRTSEIFQTDAYIFGIEFFKEEVLPLLNELHKVGSWTMYEKLKEYARIEKENELLKNEIFDLKKKMSKKP